MGQKTVEELQKMIKKKRIELTRIESLIAKQEEDDIYDDSALKSADKIEKQIEELENELWELQR